MEQQPQGLKPLREATASFSRSGPLPIVRSLHSAFTMTCFVNTPAVLATCSQPWCGACRALYPKVSICSNNCAHGAVQPHPPPYSTAADVAGLPACVLCVVAAVAGRLPGCGAAQNQL